MSNHQTALQLVPNADDFCTVQYAAAKLGRSERTIRRWIADGILTAHTPRRAPTEQPQTMLWVRQVTDVREALAKMAKRAS